MRVKWTMRHKNKFKNKLKKKFRKKRWAGAIPLLIFTAAAIYMMEASGITRNTIIHAVAKALRTNLGYQTADNCMPVLTYDASSVSQKTILDYLADSMDEMLPIYGYARKQNAQLAVGEAALMRGIPGEDSCNGSIDVLTQEMVLQENQRVEEEKIDLQGTQDGYAANERAADGAKAAGGRVQKFPRQKLNDFDYLIQNFYRVDSTTTTDSSQLNAAKMLEKDMRIVKKDAQILIYHTHSQERYADSKDESQSVVGLGDYLAQLLEDRYGYQVLHDKGEYDVPDRDSAYSKAAPALERLLEENPNVQVAIDLHRDGVKEGTRLVQKIDGKDTATIMFFNGLSHTTAQGDIAYLYNPNLADNLAFSFQMQLAAAEYYPGFSRCIYLKGYRYNLHYLPKSLLVEVGAQTNTYQEAWNAMLPLADILDKVLSGKTR